MEELFNCQKDEKNIAKEITAIIGKESSDVSNPSTKNKKLARILLKFLEDNYKTKKWFVVVFNKQTTSKIDYVSSSGFITASANGIFAAALSVSRTDDPQFAPLIKERLKHFRFPIETVKKANYMPIALTEYLLQSKEEAQVIALQFERYLGPNGQSEVESVVITTPCTTDQVKAEDYVTILSSEGFKWTRITNQDSCANKQVIVIPVGNSALPGLPQRCAVQHSGLLRNTIQQDFYLSVECNSKEDGAYIIEDRHWRNETGQRWKFVNNQLVNDNGKCLTAWTENSWYLYQYDCHPDWAGQIWIRNGLQIVNGFRLCLGVKVSTDKDIRYATQDLCDSTPQFLWYDWNSFCAK